MAEGRAPGVARQQGAGFAVALGQYKIARGDPRCAEDPLDVGGERESALSAGDVTDADPRDLYGFIDRNELSQCHFQPERCVLEAAIAETVPRDIGTLVTDRPGRRTGELAGIEILYIDRLATAVADRIVRPARELVHAAVL